MDTGTGMQLSSTCALLVLCGRQERPDLMITSDFTATSLKSLLPLLRALAAAYGLVGSSRLFSTRPAARPKEVSPYTSSVDTLMKR